jgi:IS5 family transposase
MLSNSAPHPTAATGTRALQRIRHRTGRMPRAVTADHGYGQPAVERDLHELGVNTIAIPRQGTTSAASRTLEHSRSFRKLVNGEPTVKG